MAEEFRRQVMAQAKPVLEQHIDGRFDLHEMPQGFSVGPEGVVAEYGTAFGPGTPWALRALQGVP
jgi:hypothetical protein